MFDWMVRGGAVALLALAGGMIAWRGDRLAVRVATPLFLFTVAAFALNSAPYANMVLGPTKVLTSMATHACVGCFWLFAMVLFEDRPLSPLLLAPPVTMFLVGAIGDLTALGDSDMLWVAFNAVCVALAIAVFAQITLSLRDDLIEARRSLRVWFVGAFGVLALMVLTAEFVLPRDAESASLSLAFATSLLAASALGIAALLVLAPGPFLRETRAVPTAPAARDEAALARLGALMSAGEAWRREGLTVSALAREVGVSEAVLRGLISQRLRFRNFPAFVNAHRVEAAKTALADPARGRQTIASIAFDFGFGSLAPFNRAFREQTGVTPTEWRRQSLGTT